MALPSKRPARPRAAAAPRTAAPPPAEPTAAAASDPTATTTTSQSPDTTPVTVTLRAVPAAPAATRAAAAVAFSHRGASFEPAPPADAACVVVGGGTGTLVPAAEGGGVPVAAAPARTKPPSSGVFAPRPKAVQAGPGAAAAASDEAQADAPAVTEAGVQAGPADGEGAAAPDRHPTRSVAAAARLLARVAAASTNRTSAADAVSWDDPSDARSASAASLLPLWSLPPAPPPAAGRRASPLPVAALAWCSTPPRAALAVAYGRTQPGAPGGGAVAVWAPAIDAAAPLWRVATPSPATCLAFEPAGGARLAVGFANGSVCVYDGVDGEAVAEEEGATLTTTAPTLRGGADGHASAVAALAWLAPDAADGALLASTGADGHVVAWRAARGGALAAARVAALPADPAADADPAAGLPPAALVGGTCLSVAPPPHDGALLVGDDGGGARVIVPAAGAAPAAAFGGGAAPLVAAAWSPITRGAFLTVSADGRVEFWQAARRAPAATIDLPSPAVAAAWLPCNATAAVVALADGSVAALELTRAPRGAPLLVQRVLPAGVAPTAVAVAAGDAALVAVGDGRGRVAVLRPSPNVRTAVVAAGKQETEDAAPGEADPSTGATPRGGDTAAATAVAPAADAARLDATLDWLRAAGAGY